MSTLPFTKNERVNLSTAEVLLACGDAEGLNILTEMFAGFGVHTPRRCRTIVISVSRENILKSKSRNTCKEHHKSIHHTLN